MKKALLSGALVLSASAASALVLPISPVGAPAVNCVFSPTCVLPVTDTSDPITLPGGAGSGFLQSRTFAGEPGSQAEGLTGYEYRIDLRNIRGITFVPCVDKFIVDFGPGSSLDYDGDGDLERIYVVTAGGLGTVAPSSADKAGNVITFTFAPAVCAGDSSYFFGLASPRPPRVVTTQLHTVTNDTVNVQARVPEAPPSGCELRPDLNDDFTPAERATLASSMQDFLQGPVLNMHLTTPGIHGSSLFLPWHREYISDLENFLIAEGHPEFVPLPKWDPAKPIPAEFTAVDSDCSSPPSCSALANTNPNLPLPSNLTPANICKNYSTAEDLRLGPPNPGLESWHNGVHVSIGGAMGAFNSPAAVVFWPWHGMVDDVWRTWQCCPRRFLPWAVTEILARPCLFKPCWPVWFGMDDLRFHANSPLEVRDRRGINNQGLPVGNPKPIPGLVGGALSFDGVDDHVRVKDDAELDLGIGDFSIDAWVRTADKRFQPIVSKQDAAAGFSLFLVEGRLGFSAFAGQRLAAEAPLVAPQGNVADGEWHHVAVAVDREKEGRLYVDSLPVLRFDAGAFAGDLDNAGDLFIARDSAGQAFFHGDLDELDVFRLLLTEADLDGIVSAGAAGKVGSMAGIPPLEHGDCLQDLRKLILTVPQLSKMTLAGQSLLGKIDRAIRQRQAGNERGAMRTLRALETQAERLVGNGSFDRSVFMAIEHKTQECQGKTHRH
jgi:concanavalin A-like lectin/glucanase superfamily protein/tyrosinase-like protein